MAGLSAGMPMLIGTLVALAVLTAWVALAPSNRVRVVDNRLDTYLDRSDVAAASELARPFAQRALAPMLRRVLRTAGALLPQRNLDKIQELLNRAGHPGGLTPLDFIGLRLLLAVALGGIAWFVTQQGSSGGMIAMRNGSIAALLGFMGPKTWLGRKAKARQHEIEHALPDALDMLTISVEAGLAFESAMLRVGEQWDNTLSREFKRSVAEMRLGMPRNETLRRMAERCDVDDLTTFVAVLIQSNQMGVSIASVLASQADQMRLKRRQHAEERSRQASVKIVLVVAMFILPALFIVILGPVIPRIVNILASVGG